MTEAVPDPTAASAPSAGRSFVERVVGVLRLDGAAYEEIASDPAALGQAAAVVIAAAAARALGALGGPFSTQGLLFLAQVTALWPISALLVLAIGHWFGHPQSFARVARVMGFALAPFLLTALAVVPVEAVQIAVAFLSTALLIATFVVGVRHALQTDTGRAGLLTLIIALVLVFVSMLYGYLTA